MPIEIPSITWACRGECAHAPVMSQMVVQPGIIVIPASETNTGPGAPPQLLHTVTVQLTAQPTAAVWVDMSAPTSWDGSRLAAATPSRLVLYPADNHNVDDEDANSGTTHQSSRSSASLPRADFRLDVGQQPVGDFFVQLSLSSEDGAFDGAMHTLRVRDDVCACESLQGVAAVVGTTEHTAAVQRPP